LHRIAFPVVSEWCQKPLSYVRADLAQLYSVG
jgi:hypothetical protein